MSPSPQKRRKWLRFFAFFLIPILVLAASNTLLMRSDAHTYYTFLEITQRSDIDLALVGSSIVFSDFNANIITEKTGLETFDVTVGHMSMPGALAATRLLYKTNRPRYVALVVESDNFTKTTEDIQAQFRLAPFLRKHPLIYLRYYLDLCSQDQKYLDRILLFKSFFVRDLEDVRHTIAMHTNPEAYFASSGLLDGVGVYQGRGFLRYNAAGNGYDALRFTPLRPQQADDNPDLHEFSKKKLLEYRALCEKHGSELLVIISPNATAQGLGRAGFLEKNAALAEFCREESIPCFDMSLAKPEFIPLLDSHYHDWYHLDGEGADLFSEKFADFLNLYLAGKPVDHLFYSSMDEYLDSIDFITNAWIDQSSSDGEDVFTADCLHGRTVTPEYAFYLVGDDASHELLQDYSSDSTYRCASGSLAGRRLRVYARPVGSQEALPLVYADLILP